jgi:hypothetical protein
MYVGKPQATYFYVGLSFASEGFTRVLSYMMAPPTHLYMI